MILPPRFSVPAVAIPAVSVPDVETIARRGAELVLAFERSEAGTVRPARRR